MKLLQATEAARQKLRQAEIHIASSNGEYSAAIEQVLIGKFPSSDTELPPALIDWSQYGHLKDLEFENLPDKRVQMIISASHFANILAQATFRRGPLDGPLGIDTFFGWTVMGAFGKNFSRSATIAFLKKDDQQLEDWKQKIFNHDFQPLKDDGKGLSRQAKFALKQMQDSIKLNADGKYEVALPYTIGRKEAAEILNKVDSKATATTRMWQLKRSLQKIPEKKAKGFSEMKKFLEKGRAIPLTEEAKREQEENGWPVWYLPCHLVHQKGKYRFCHDGRAATDGVCLNELLINDLNLMTPILDPINNLRRYLYAFSTDIEAFFHNILVELQDRHCFRFLWYTDEDMRMLAEYIFLAYIFGSSASPTVTAFVLARHAEYVRDKFGPEVVEIIKRYFYVDDTSGGSNSLEKCRRICADLEVAMAMGGFSLSKWKYSHKELVRGEEVEEEQERMQKILGIVWDLEEDTLSVAIEPEKFVKEATTPRMVVQQQAGLYDPLGLIAPFILIGRSWTQKSMTKDWSWDKPLTEEVKGGFNKWTSEIPDLASLRIPRAWDTPETADEEEEFHVFSDASGYGYGSVLYRRAWKRDGAIVVSFIQGRSHVVPKDAARAGHHNSTPRLELVASVKSIDILEVNQASLSKKIEKVTYWTDSACVLKWINDRTSTQKAFVANRISKIDSKSSARQWRFVSSCLNPADLTSRGISASETSKWEFYHRGPAFLRLPEEDWPKMNPPEIEQLEERKIHAFYAEEDSEEDTLTPSESDQTLVWIWSVISDISGWENKRRIVATLKNCVKIWKIKTFRKKSRLRSRKIEKILQKRFSNIARSEKILIRAIQTNAFLKEKEAMIEEKESGKGKRRQLPDKSSSISSLNPFVDDDGVIRVGSRLARSDLRKEEKFPAILPKEDANVKDLIREVHAKEMHAGPKHVLACLRNKFWILQGLQVVKKTVSRCVKCQTNNKPPCSQMMAALPPERLLMSTPFQHCGIDYMGPFGVLMNGRATHKVWVAVFSCFQSRAVHAEVVMKLDANSCINAIARFAARRPGLQKLFSDNASNFTCADKELKKETEKINEKIRPSLLKRGIEWSFIPPYSPHRGGIWERIVGMFKKNLKAVASSSTMHFDVFTTVITEAEAVINRRPLTALSTDSRDGEALTPLHIISPAAASNVEYSPIQTIEEVDGDLARRSWKRAQVLVQQFWKLFRSGFVSMMHNRPKWKRAKENLKVDDFVLLVNETVERHAWKTGVIVKVDEAVDGCVRTVDVKTADGKIHTRDRTKLVLLELD